MTLQWLQKEISLLCSCMSYFWYHSASHVVPLFTSNQPIRIQPGFVNVLLNELEVSNRSAWSKVGNSYLPLCSEITWQFSVKRMIIQILLGCWGFWKYEASLVLWITCVLCALGLASCPPLLLTLKCDCEMLMHLFKSFRCEKWLHFHLQLLQNNTFEKMKDKKHSSTVEATTEFSFNHCITVTWV